jgi:hypothetical protein
VVLFNRRKSSACSQRRMAGLGLSLRFENTNPNLHKLTLTLMRMTLRICQHFYNFQGTRATMGTEARQPGTSRAPKNSMLFDKVVPALLILMGVLTVLLILFAAGVLLGFIHF